MQAAQFLMVGGFVMLAWVLARRKIRAGKKVHEDTKRANREIKLMREHKEPSVPLSGAPAETQRWQAAMFDLQRELKAELDTRIIVVQTLLNQVDEKIHQLNSLQSELEPVHAAELSIRTKIQELVQRGLNAREIAMNTGMPLDDVELTIASL
ncbi:MAG: hypothetical protein CBD74_08230 [Saprospirales bacterium TMED214]|nr:MAG: hypothetical protein CBD74_08230 [Saprospirales bacterium TMED214]